MFILFVCASLIHDLFQPNLQRAQDIAFVIPQIAFETIVFLERSKLNVFSRWRGIEPLILADYGKFDKLTSLPLDTHLPLCIWIKYKYIFEHTKMIFIGTKTTSCYSMKKIINAQ